MPTEQLPHHLAGHPVEHKRYGWLGVVAPYAHTEHQTMIIWDHSSTRGAGLADSSDLAITVQNTLNLFEGGS